MTRPIDRKFSSIFFASWGAAVLFSFFADAPGAYAACGGSTRTWAGTNTTTWGTNSNWSPQDAPNTTTEDAYIAASARATNANGTVSIGCLEISGGTMNGSSNGVTLTITGDYFRNLTTGSMSVTSGRSWKINMSSAAGTTTQYFDNVDTINYLVVTNTASGYQLHLRYPFLVRNELDLSGMTAGTGTVIIEDTVEISAGNITIPSGVTLRVASGGALKYRTTGGSITVNGGGTLQIDGGGSLSIGSGSTLTVNGTLTLNGSPANIARLEAEGTGITFNLNMNGTLNSSYFKIKGLSTNGMVLGNTATVASMGNGEFHYIASGGYAMTLGTTTNLPATIDGVGFFNDGGYAVANNVNATAYAQNASITFTDYAGDVAGATYETEPAGTVCGANPPGCIRWGTAQPTKLVINNSTPNAQVPTVQWSSAGSPPRFPYKNFLTLGFGLNQAATATDISSVTITMSGTASSSEFTGVSLYKDAGGGTTCSWDSATDTLIGTYTPTGNPPAFTASGLTGISPSGVTPVCLHVVVSAVDSAITGHTVQVSVLATSDVTNSQGYSFSNASGPPLYSDSSSIVNSSVTTRDWRGGTSNAWNTLLNWSGNAVPTAATSCDIGSGTNPTNIDVVTASCLNARLLTGATLSYGAPTNSLNIYGSLEIQSGVTFSGSQGSIVMAGSANQSVSGATAFPGPFTVNQGVTTQVVSIDSDVTLSGALTITQGTLRISSGYTLTVGGGVTINGGTLDIEPGATLALADGTSLTLSSGTLELMGTSGSSSTITSSAGASAYTVVLSGGTVKAQYYNFDHLGTNGVTVNSGVTIDPTYYFQNGSFTYPVNNGSTFLRLYQKIPGNALANMTFDAAGSSATGTVSIYTDSGIAAGDTLAVSSYSGSVTGVGTENASANYPVSWSGAVNTLDIVRTAGDVGPGAVSAGSTYYMGRFQLSQTLAGASYADTDISSVKLTLTGTGSGTDVSQIRIYKDDTCAATSGGTLLGTGTFAGSPSSVTFSGISGFTLTANPTNTVVCLYVEYDIASGATNLNTVGAQIAAVGDVFNSQSYAFSATNRPPVNLGTEATIAGSLNAIWTGASSTAWATAGNWTGGVPDSTKNCTINNVSNKPVIASGATGTCKTLTIASGSSITLTDSSSTLEVYSHLTNNGNITQNGGAIKFRDGGVAISQTLTSPNTLTSIDLSQKTGTGAASIMKTSGIITLTNQLVLPTGTAFEFQVPSASGIILNGGLDIQASTFNLQAGGVIQFASGQGVTLASPGTFETTGTNDVYPQSTSNKAAITATSGTWSFLANSGTVDLVGFRFDKLDTNGIRIFGTASLTNFSGGQFTLLANAAANPGMKALNLNTSSPINLTPTNIGWEWQAANSTYLAGTSPAVTDSYYLVYAANCGNGTLTFDQWFGDFYQAINTPDPSTKVSATSCTVSIAAAASPVTLTRFAAVGYDGTVAVEWETGSELDHLGFNVYRSMSPSEGFIQINPRLVRNLLTSGSFHGVYRYVDSDVVNGIPYYYRIEDLATNGARVLHGPVSALPEASLGTVPVPDSSTNVGESGSGNPNPALGGGGAIAAPGAKDLGNGVRVLTQTGNLLKLEIVVPAPVFAVSAWNGAYETVAVPGYSSTLTAGYPELLERDVLVELDDVATQVSVLNGSVVDASYGAHAIAPAPSWQIVSGAPTPSWSPDSAAYSSAALSPAAYYSVASSSEQAGNRSFLRIHLNPVRWNATTQELRAAQTITLDIALSGGTWSQPSTTVLSGLAPSATEGALRIRYAASGMHELLFDDLTSLGLEGPWAGADPALFRLYRGRQELPIEVVDGGSAFGSGDAIRFYASYGRELDDAENEVVLLSNGMGNDAAPPLRMAHSNADPTGRALNGEAGSRAHVSAEQDLLPMFDVPYGGRVDHYFWGRVYRQAGYAPTSDSSYAFQINAPELLPWAQPATLTVYAKGRSGLDQNPLHHVRIYLNGSTVALDERVFATNGQVIPLSFSVPSSLLFSGLNEVRVEAVGDLIQNDDTDIVDVDRITLDYTARRTAVLGMAELSNQQSGSALNVDGFGPAGAIAVYDISDGDLPGILDGVAVSSPDGGVTTQARFAAEIADDFSTGVRFAAVEAGAYLRPSGLFLGHGVEYSLRDSTLGADWIVIGERGLLRAARELIQWREAQGLRVVTAPIDQVYAEFGTGTKSADAIREFLAYAYTTWHEPRPKYVLILGRASYGSRASSEMPVALEQGQYMDYGSDHWLVADEANPNQPLLAIGRIATNNEVELAQVVAKILDYESGALSPSGAAASKLAFIADRDRMSEGFDRYSQSLLDTAHAARASFGSAQVSLSASLAQTQAIRDAFAADSLFLTYVGHGAEERWSDDDFGSPIFSSSDASLLQNQKLPIVLGLACLNSYFYDADPAFPKSLGQSLVENSSGGAIAFWGSTAQTAPIAQTALARGLFDELGRVTANGESQVRLGDLLLRAKTAAALNPALTDVVRSYTLFGDPALKLPAEAFVAQAAPVAAPAPAPAAAASSEEKSGGGFLSCGTINAGGKSGGPGGPTAMAGAIAELLLLLGMCGFGRRLLRGR